MHQSHGDVPSEPRGGKRVLWGVVCGLGYQDGDCAPAVRRQAPLVVEGRELCVHAGARAWST